MHDPWLERLYRYFHNRSAGDANAPHSRHATSRAGRQWRQAAVLVPIVRPDADHPCQVILTVRTQGLRSHAGQVALPGGTRDSGDFSTVQTALRESREEINLAAEDVEVIGQLGKLLLPSGYQVTPVVGLVEGTARLEPEPAEVAVIFRVPASLVLDPANYRQTAYRANGRRLRTLELHYGAYRIWGATATILHYLGRQLQPK